MGLFNTTIATFTPSTDHAGRGGNVYSEIKPSDLLGTNSTSRYQVQKADNGTQNIVKLGLLQGFFQIVKNCLTSSNLNDLKEFTVSAYATHPIHDLLTAESRDSVDLQQQVKDYLNDRSKKIDHFPLLNLIRESLHTDSLNSKVRGLVDQECTLNEQMYLNQSLNL